MREHMLVCDVHAIGCWNKPLAKRNKRTRAMRGRKRVAKQAVEETGATLESEHKCNRRRANSTAERVRRSRAASQVRDTQRANQMYFPTVRRVCHGVLLQLYSFCCSVRMKYLLNESKIVEHYRQDSGKVLQHFVRPMSRYLASHPARQPCQR